MKRGFDVLRDKTAYRSIAFTRPERDRLGLRGLLPHRVCTDREMVERVSKERAFLASCGEVIQLVGHCNVLR